AQRASRQEHADADGLSPEVQRQRTHHRVRRAEGRAEADARATRCYPHVSRADALQRIAEREEGAEAAGRRVRVAVCRHLDRRLAAQPAVAEVAGVRRGGAVLPRRAVLLLRELQPAAAVELLTKIDAKAVGGT